MAHAQKPDFVFRRKGRVHLNRQGRQFSRLLAAEVCASAVVMLDTPSSEVVWRVLATHTIRQFSLYFPSRASPCAIAYQLDSIYNSYLHLRYTIPDPFRYFVICSIFCKRFLSHAQSKIWQAVHQLSTSVYSAHARSVGHHLQNATSDRAMRPWQETRLCAKREHNLSHSVL
jgi:hypothetical protein